MRPGRLEDGLVRRMDVNPERPLLGESCECHKGGRIEGETLEWDKREDDGFELL